MIPYANASLLAITPVGTSTDYDIPEADGIARWTGTQAVYIAEEIVEVLSPGRVDEIKQTRLEIPYDVGKLVQRGDSVTYTYEDASRKRTAGTISHAKLVGRVRVMLLDDEEIVSSGPLSMLNAGTLIESGTVLA